VEKRREVTNNICQIKYGFCASKAERTCEVTEGRERRTGGEKNHKRNLREL
jgi:hypothetical protein